MSRMRKGTRMRKALHKVTRHVKTAVVVLGLSSSGLVKANRNLTDYFEGQPKANQIVHVKSLKVMKEKMKRGEKIHHEFLLIRLKVKFPSHSTRGTIRVDKSYNEASSQGEKAGGVIELDIVHPFSLEGATIKCDLDLTKCGGMAFKDLLKDLTEHNLRYYIATDNCWKYALDASRKVAMRCKELPDTDEVTRRKIEQFLEVLPDIDGVTQKAMKLVLKKLPDTDGVKQKAIKLFPSSWKSSQTPMG